MSIRRIHALLQTCFNISAKVLLDTVFAPYYRHIHVWGRPHWSPSAMSAATLTHCAKIRGSIAKMCKHLRRKKDTRSHRQRNNAYNSLVYKTCYPLAKNSRPTSRGGRLELSLPPKRSPPIYSRMSRHVTSPDQQILADMKIHLHHQRAS